MEKKSIQNFRGMTFFECFKCMNMKFDKINKDKIEIEMLFLLQVFSLTSFSVTSSLHSFYQSLADGSVQV